MTHAGKLSWSHASEEFYRKEFVHAARTTVAAIASLLIDAAKQRAERIDPRSLARWLGDPF